MASRTYGSTVIPGVEATVQPGGTVPVSVGVERSAVLIGGMDTGNGSATTGDAVEIENNSEAITQFGDGSELQRAARLALLNGVTELWCVPVPESTASAEAKSTQSGTLNNAPLFDPNVNEEHSITVSDTGGGTLTVNIVYESTVSAPGTADTVNINPISGDYNADAGPDGTDYEFTYDYGDYSSTVMQTAADKETRYVIPLHEDTSVINDALSEVNSNDDQFVFQHTVGNASMRESGTTAASYATNYTDSFDDFRLSVVSPSRGYVDDDETEEVRLCAAVGGYLASRSLGDSATADQISGITGLRTDYAPADAGNLIDEQVLPVIRDGGVEIAKDMTTSTEPKFERVFAIEIMDEVTQLAHNVSKRFVGELQTPINRYLLDRSLRTFLREMRDESPKLLDGFNVDVNQNSTNDDQTDVELGLDIVNTMDVIKLDMLVGDVVLNGGAS